jgi:hypothetical protein
MKLVTVGCMLAALLLGSQQQARGETRVRARRALLIANAAYQHLPPLQTPRPSVDALANSLSKARFQPQVVYDLPQTALIDTIRKFVDTVQPGDFVLIYYSGYGYQADEVNYILPVGFDPKDQVAPGLTAFSVRNLQRKLELRKAGTKMLLLDASRPAPGLPNGLAGMRAAGNTLVSFSAALNQSAPDPPGGGVDLYTRALIKAIDEPGSKPAGVLMRTQTEVSRLSAGKQMPHVIETPVPDFDFNPPAVLSTEVTGGPTGGTTGGAKGGDKPPDSGAVPAETDPNIGAAATGPVWPMDGGNARRSGYSPYRGPRKPRIAWSVEAGNKDQNSPLIGPDGRVYVWNAREKVLRCVEDGRIVWKVALPLDEQVSFGPDGSVQLSSFLGKTRTLNREGNPSQETRSDMRWLGLYFWRGHTYKSTGIAPEGSTTTRWYFIRPDDPTWRVEVDGQATAPVVDLRGILHFGTTKGTLYAVTDAATVEWSYSTGTSPTRGLCFTPKQGVVAAVGQSLFSVREGRLQWKFQGDGDGNAFPPIHDFAGTIYFGKGTDFYAVSLTGKLVWKLPLGDSVTSAPAMDRSGRIYVNSATRLYCISD